jgi:hypothetical protein
MRGVDFVYDAPLPLGRAQTPKLCRELANDDFSIAVDQGAGVAFELLQRIPVRRAGRRRRDISSNLDCWRSNRSHSCRLFETSGAD